MRRERARESSGGIVRFSTNRDVTRAAFDLAGRIYVVDIGSGAATELRRAGGPSTRGSTPPAHVSRMSSGRTARGGSTATEPRVLKRPENDHVMYGLAEFVAAEEMGRQRGILVVSRRLASARGPRRRRAVQRWHIADPANPESPPIEVAYPQAGTDNAEVTLHIRRPSTARRLSRCGWDTRRFRVRDRRRLVRAWAPHRGAEPRSAEHADPRGGCRDRRDGTGARGHRRRVGRHRRTGCPARLPDGTLVWTADRDGAKRLVIGDEPVTGADLEVRDVLDVDGDVVLFRASAEPTEVGMYTWSRAEGVAQLKPQGIDRRVWRARASRRWHHGADPSRTSIAPGRVISVHADDREVGDDRVVSPRPRRSQLNVRLATLGNAASAPQSCSRTGTSRAARKLPVLLDPYGGPGNSEGARVCGRVSGVAVVRGPGVCGARGRRQGHTRARTGSGRGRSAAIWRHRFSRTRSTGCMPRRPRSGRTWTCRGSRSAAGRSADTWPRLRCCAGPMCFMSRSRGPVTDWHLYDTHYTERYLGHPDDEPANYETVSLLADAPVWNAR